MIQIGDAEFTVKQIVNARGQRVDALLIDTFVEE